MKRRVFSRVALFYCMAFAGAARASSAQVPATTVIIVRHAEKAAQPASDPPLTEEGRARAQALALALKDAGVSAVITTQFARTRETAAPTADEFHLTPIVVPASNAVADHAHAVAAAVMQHAGGTVLVVGHSNTVAEIVAALGATQPADLCDAEYDAMFVVTVAWGGRASVLKARYGKAMPVADGCGNAMTSPKDAPARAPEQFRVRVETSRGPFVLEINRAWAPIGVDHFFNLVRNGYYDDSRFSRVVPGFIAQFGIAGDPRVASLWRDRPIADDSVRAHNERGTIAYAMTGPNTRTTQLYISLRDNTRLDAQGFAPIGRVVEGMSVVDSLYDGYGETSGGGVRAGNQAPLFAGGNAYVDAHYPKLDRLISAHIVN